MFEIDGSQKSGSGTIVRCSVSIASLLKEDLHLYNARVKREKPGLRPQHLKAIEASCQICKGKLEGGSVGSKEFTYRPGQIIFGGNYSFDIGTAGSTTMLAQTILPLLFFADKPSKVKISGGLFQDFAPGAYHLKQVVFPLLSKMGLNAGIEVIKPGYVPRGSGIIELRVEPTKENLKPLNLMEQGKVISIKGIAVSSHLKERKVSERMAEACKQTLSKCGYRADIELIYDETSIQKGATLSIYAETDTGCIIGSDMAGALGRTSEYIGKHAAQSLIEDLELGATVDRFTADQLILYAAVADGETRYVIPRMTEHIKSNLWLAEEMLGAKVELENRHLKIRGVPL
jgi:RNA 3'-terminal phosphate cyclase (ATP)